jgi:hypothetical protein
LPEYNPNKIKAPYAYVIKIDNYGRFAHKPRVMVTYKPGALQPGITIIAAAGTMVHYTTDGSEPTESSAIYQDPFLLEKTCIVKARSFVNGILSSATVSQQAIKYEWMSAVKAGNPKPGITYKYYEPEKSINMISSFKTNMINSGITDMISLAKKQRQDKFAFEFSGYIKIPQDSIYTFYTSSDDGSQLFIDDGEVVDNDGDHGTVEKNGRVALKKGYHTIRVLYFDSGGGNELKVFMQPEGGKKEELSSTFLYH